MQTYCSCCRGELYWCCCRSLYQYGELVSHSMVASTPALEGNAHCVGQIFQKQDHLYPFISLHPPLPTCIQEKDGCAGEGGGVEASLMLREVSTHHRAQDEANTGGCIKVSHH